MTALRIDVVSYPFTQHPDETKLIVSGSVGTFPLKTRALELFRNLERDYIDTYVEEAVHSYLYGETFRDMARNLSAVRKMARAHEASSAP